MLRISLAVAALLLFFTATFSATAAQRTFVSTSGNDANTASNCSNTAPCRGFTAALTVTDSGGEIVVLSSGGYGPVTIDKSVSIIAPEGIYAGVSVFSGHGVYIATPGVKVVLRGLTIKRLAGTGSGVMMVFGDSLSVQHCTISDFSSGYGLYVGTPAKVNVLDSLLEGNSTGADFVDGPTALVSRSRFIDNVTDGLTASASGSGVVTRIEVSHSEASGNAGAGFYAVASGSGRTEINIKDAIASRSTFGAYAFSSTGVVTASVSNSLISGNTSRGLVSNGSGAKLVASGNKVTHNGTGLYQYDSAVFESTGDNTVRDNTSATLGTITSLGNM
ncbi:MAG: right-handed parallel beta-helix repeat-containing protein [Betaproteobacteria bacterium]|nr:right-handed parallel beta-helix repeat-containing protein [Betaproteobacteria bacterium]